MQLRGYQDYYTDGLTDRISGAANWQAAGRAIVTYLPFPPLFTGSAVSAACKEKKTSECCRYTEVLRRLFILEM